MKSTETSKVMDILKKAAGAYDDDALKEMKKMVMQVRQRGQRFTHPGFDHAGIVERFGTKISSFHDVAAAIEFLWANPPPPLSDFAVGDVVFVPGSAWSGSLWDKPGAWYRARVSSKVSKRGKVCIVFDGTEDSATVDARALEEYQEQHTASEMHFLPRDKFEIMLDMVLETVRKELVLAFTEATA